MRRVTGGHAHIEVDDQGSATTLNISTAPTAEHTAPLGSRQGTSSSSAMAGKKAARRAAPEAASTARPQKRARESAAERPAGQATASADAPPVVTDDRFASLHWDPRFSRVPKRTTKLPVDDRFKEALLQNPAFCGSSAPVDRFGRPKLHKGKDAALARLYDIGSSSDDDGDEDNEDTESGEDVVGRVEDDDGGGSFAPGGDFHAAGVACDSQYEEEEVREVIVRGEATRRLAVMGLDWSNARAVDIFVSLQSFCPPGKVLKEVKVHPSKFGLERLALEAKLGPQVLQPMDRAILDGLSGENAAEGDAGGPGEADEAEAGSAVESGGEGSGSGEDGSEGDSETLSSEDEDEDEVRGVMETALDVDARKQEEQSKMRKYEEDRLKYYFAVADFEDVKTADAVYEQCDGVEYETTGLAFDLRFVPNDMVIDAPVRDSATSIPDGYMPPNLAPSTLNNCKVKLSWDADAPDRAVLKKRMVGRHEEDEENLKAYLASASESEEGAGAFEAADAEDAATMKRDLEQKRRLLLGIGDCTGDDENGVNDEDMEMEVTFEPGLQDKGEEIAKRKDLREKSADETPWEARLRRMQERKAEKRKTRKEHFAKADRTGKDASSADSDDGMHGDVADNPQFTDDPFFSAAFSDDDEPAAAKSAKAGSKSGSISKKEKQRQKRSSKVTGDVYDDEGLPDEDAVENARRNANLELVMLDDDRRKRGPSVRDRLIAAESDDDGAGDEDMKKQKKKRSRGRRRSDREAAAAAAFREAPASALDVTDERFSSLFSSHLYAMDPTHPKFKRNETTEKILNEKSRRGGSTAQSAASASLAAANGDDGIPAEKSRERNYVPAPGGGDDVMSLAASIKAKANRNDKKSMKGKSRN
jgi:NUC153 domain